jgi:SAM-dependent methyltransferase
LAVPACTAGRDSPIARIAYYDRIAHQWSRATGHHGGALKRYALNDRILARIPAIADRDILELGAGNGYFATLLRRRFSGQTPHSLILSDQSQALLDIAQGEFRVADADYQRIDVQEPLPFADASVDLILATMLLNELPTTYARLALTECARILCVGGQLLAAVPHPAFVHALAKKGALTDFGRGLFAMPSAEGLRLPVARRTVEAYDALFVEARLTVAREDILADEKIRHEKPGLSVGRDVPLALLFDARKP